MSSRALVAVVVVALLAAAAPARAAGPPAGPAILHWPAPRAPQLENTGVWRAAPILMSGTSAYRQGEFLYQDWIYDDAGAGYAYPPDRVYERNAADIVEIRLKPLGDATAIRITYNTMLDPDLVATTIALGSSPGPHPMPHDANCVQPGEVFVTAHGSTADAVDAATGAAIAGATPSVAIDLERRQVEVRVPYGVFDPRDEADVRVAAATGLWSPSEGRYRVPEPASPAWQAPGLPGAPSGDDTPCAFFNVAFRYDEPRADFSNAKQREAVAAGDLSRYFARVDFRKLADGVDDEMPGQPSGVPLSGVVNRIYASHFEPHQGRGRRNVGDLSDPQQTVGPTGVIPHQPCELDDCAPEFAGQLQPYALYLPRKAAGAAGYGLSLLLHGCEWSYNMWAQRDEAVSMRAFAERGQGALVATPQNRSVCLWQYDEAGADTYEVWADVARHYDVDPSFVTIAGESLGGYGTWKNAVQFPDLFAAAGPDIGPLAPGAGWPGPPVIAPGGEAAATFPHMPSLRNLPVVIFAGVADPLVPFTATRRASDDLGALGYRHMMYAFSGHHDLVDLTPMAKYAGTRRVERDPPHVTYVFSAFMHQPRFGLNSDHAYWLSGLTLRDASLDPPIGTIDVFSHGFGAADPEPLPVESGTGSVRATDDGREMPAATTTTGWAQAQGAPARNVLDVVAQNIRTVTIDPDRARVACDAKINVTSDGPLTVRLAGCPKAKRAAGGAQRVCASRRSFMINLRRPRGWSVRRTVVMLNGRRIRTRTARGARGIRRERVDLRGLHPDVVRIRVRMTLRRGGRVRTLDDRRTYRTCARR